MKNFLKFLIYCMAFISATVSAQSCDCSRVESSCTAQVAVKNITGTKGGSNFSAEVHLYSSEPRCSKISFFIDNTPYISILNNSNTAVENTYGTSQIDERSVSIDYCRVCSLAEKPANSLQDPIAQRFNNAIGSTLDKNAEVAAANDAASTVEHVGDSSDDLLNVLGAIQGVLPGLRGSRGSNPQGISGRGGQLPSNCKADPRAKGCPYYREPLKTAVFSQSQAQAA